MSTPRAEQDWPVLRSYEGEHLAEVALPLGGIGTGTISLGGRGNLQDWELVNRPAKGFAPANSFLALSVGDPAGRRVTRALEGALRPPFSGWMGAGWGGYGPRNPGLPRFRECRFEAAYPFGRVRLSDPDVPVAAVIEGFNPLVPGDPGASGLPVAVLTVGLTNLAEHVLDATVAVTLENFIGTDGTKGAPRGNWNELRSDDGEGVRGIFCTSRGVPPDDPCYGSLALGTPERDISCRTAWAELAFSDALLDFWDDLDGDGRLDERVRCAAAAPMASLAVHGALPARGTRSVTIIIAWHFPNRLTWSPEAVGPEEGAQKDAGGCCPGPDGSPACARGWVGNHYATRFADAWDVVFRTAPAIGELRARTAAFLRAYLSADIPEVLKEAGLFNLSALRSQTSFRTADGRFYGFEGCSDDTGCCLGSCTHVWNYEPATALLFGELARSMREVELAHATRADGHMSFRALLPLEHAQEYPVAAADGQMGCIVKLYREWQLCGDDAFLQYLWPKARAALSYAWVEHGWDADRDGVMEGCQHNTMDVEYHGPNPQMQTWYLAALRAAEEMAEHVGEEGFARECRRLFGLGSSWTDANLFNGEYYEQQVRPPGKAGAIADGLSAAPYDDERAVDPPHQLGRGCLVDQLVGQYMAHVAGLGYLLDPAKVRAALTAVYEHNHREGMWAHFNHSRSYALSDEAGLLMATYPRGGRPARPFPYFNEVMTGFEHTAAAGMLYEGMDELALRVVKDVRDRHDGRRRNPFNEPECGHHYARAMAAWGSVLAVTGFRWSAVTGCFTVRATPGPARFFWSNGGAWGTVLQVPRREGREVTIDALEGSVEIRRVEATGAGSVDLREPRCATSRKPVRVVLPAEHRP